MSYIIINSIITMIIFGIMCFLANYILCGFSRFSMIRHHVTEQPASDVSSQKSGTETLLTKQPVMQCHIERHGHVNHTAADIQKTYKYLISLLYYISNCLMKAMVYSLQFSFLHQSYLPPLVKINVILTFLLHFCPGFAILHLFILYRCTFTVFVISSGFLNKQFIYLNSRMFIYI